MIQDIFPHVLNVEFDNQPEPGVNDFVFVFKENSLLLKKNDDSYEIPRRKEIGGISDHLKDKFLFSFNQTPCFLIMGQDIAETIDFTYNEISFFRLAKQKEVAWVSLIAYQLMNWYDQNQYCGKCGSQTEEKSHERALICLKCNHTVYPKISPAIIVLIVSNDQILLAHNSNFRRDWYSLVAGYADIGESLEDAVIREVKEEVGLDVKNIRYYKSQPWPLSGSMMIGFIADADINQPIQVDGKEIEKAEWYKRGALPNHPTNISIAGEMIDRFENHEL